MSKAIVGTFNKIPKLKSSHSYGWARTWSENLDIPIDHTNTYHHVVYLLHGANFGGSINLFGGFTQELKDSVDSLMKADKIISLDIDMPDYGAMLKKRKDVEDKDWCDALSAKLLTATKLVSSDLEFTHLAIGDSHTASYAPKDCSVVKRDGTTLRGQINSGFDYILEHIKPHHKSLTISLGNIDVRHHIVRHDTNVEEMVESLKAFGDSTGLDVEYSVPWPIEYEGRKLPKTGFYKGTSFYGSREQRQEVVGRYAAHMERLGMRTVSAPQEWYLMDCEEYAKTRMEGRQSVHLNPEYYRRENWGHIDTTLEEFFG